MFYTFARFVCRVVLVCLRRWEVRGLANLPAQGGMVLVANHTSYWDPVVIGCAINRRINFMAKAELFAIPLLGQAIRAVGTFPVKRNHSDRTAIRTALKLLKEGHIVGVFPEGTRSSSGELLPPHQGASMLALRAGVPLLPVALHGTKGVFGKITVNIGAPFLYPAGDKVTRADLENASNQIMARIAALLEDI